MASQAKSSQVNDLVLGFIEDAHLMRKRGSCLLRGLVHRGMHVQRDASATAPVVSRRRECFSAEEARSIHAQITKTGLEHDISVASNVVQMYLNCGNVEEALQAFYRMPRRPGVILWTNMIAAYGKQGSVNKAMEMFQQMQLEDVMPDRVTCITMLNICASCLGLEEGEKVHSFLKCKGIAFDARVGNALIHMYGKCGSVEDARGVFEELQQRDVVSWTAMIAAYAQNGHIELAHLLHWQMHLEGVRPNNVTFLAILNACFGPEDLAVGKMIHAVVVESGFDLHHLPVGNAIVSMYARCGSLKDARGMFNRMSQRDVITWTAMIAANAQSGHCKEAMVLFRQMQVEGVMPSKTTVVSALSACGVLAEGRIIHGMSVYMGIQMEVIVGNALVNMYGKCGSSKDARGVFDKMTQRVVISWTSMIAAYARNGHLESALQLFWRMQLEREVVADMVTFITILPACSKLAEGKLIHQCMSETGVESDVFVGTALVDMYAKCGSLKDAQIVFERMPRRDAVAWTVLIAAYAHHGHCRKALQLFHQMQLEDITPDKNSLLCALNACASLGELAQGKQIHSLVLKRGLETDMVVANTLVNLYGKCGDLEVARSIFDGMEQRNEISWNTMIAAYAQAGNYTAVLQLFEQMEQENVVPDKITYVMVLDACANLSALSEGRQVHARVAEKLLDVDVVVGTVIVNMYGKCGKLEDAQKMFDKMPERNLITWNAVVAAYAQNGHTEVSLRLFGGMQQEGVKPDGVTFISIFASCGHAGSVEDASRYFASMRGDYGITHKMEHYGCMIDLLGRMGWLEETEEFMKKMPVQPNVVHWTALLGACITHNDVERGKRAAEYLVQLDPQNASAYVVLFNIYAASGS